MVWQIAQTGVILVNRLSPLTFCLICSSNMPDWTATVLLTSCEQLCLWLWLLLLWWVEFLWTSFLFPPPKPSGLSLIAHSFPAVLLQKTTVCGRLWAHRLSLDSSLVVLLTFLWCLITQSHLFWTKFVGMLTCHLLFPGYLLHICLTLTSMLTKNSGSASLWCDAVQKPWCVLTDTLVFGVYVFWLTWLPWLDRAHLVW